MGMLQRQIILNGLFILCLIILRPGAGFGMAVSGTQVHSLTQVLG